MHGVAKILPCAPFFFGLQDWNTSQFSSSSPSMDLTDQHSNEEKCGHRKRPLDDEAYPVNPGCIQHPVVHGKCFFRFQWQSLVTHIALACRQGARLRLSSLLWTPRVLSMLWWLTTAMCLHSAVAASFGSRISALHCHLELNWLFFLSSSFSDTMVSVYEATMPCEDYALVSLLCDGDYDTVNLLQVSDYLSPHIICRQGCLAVVLQLHVGSHAVVWATPCSQLSQTANLLVCTVKHGEMIYRQVVAWCQVWCWVAPSISLRLRHLCWESESVHAWNTEKLHQHLDSRDFHQRTLVHQQHLVQHFRLDAQPNNWVFAGMRAYCESLDWSIRSRMHQHPKTVPTLLQ